MMASRRLKNIVQDSSFPSFIMLVVLIIVNAILQPGVLLPAGLPHELHDLHPAHPGEPGPGNAPARGRRGLSLGRGISLVSCVMASLMMDNPVSIVLITLLGVAVALTLSLSTGSSLPTSVLHRSS